MSIDWDDDYCDSGHAILRLECGECVAALRANLKAAEERAEKAERDAESAWHHWRGADAERVSLREELAALKKKYRGLQTSLSEALNSGDGSYRP